jgi:hypothetical protein
VVRADADTPYGLYWHDFFLKVDANPAGSLTVVQYMSGSNTVAGLRVVPVDSTNFQVQIRDVTAQRWTSTSLAVGAWHRVAVKVDPGTALRCRVYSGANLDTDTVSQDSGDVANSNAAAASLTTLDNVRYGGSAANTSTLNFARIRSNDATQPTMGTGGGGGTTIADLTDGFEDGTAGNVLTSGTSFISSHTGGFSGTFFADPYANVNCYRSNPAASIDNYRIDTTDPIAKGWIKFGLKVVTQPGGSVAIIQVYSTTTNQVGNLRIVPGAGVFQLQWRNGASTQVAISSNLALNTYHEVAIWVDPALGQVRLKVYSGANRGTGTSTYDSTLLTSAPAGGATTFNLVRIGTLTTETNDIRFDVFRADTTTEPAGILPPSSPIAAAITCPTSAGHEPDELATLSVGVTGGTAPYTYTLHQTAGTTQTVSGSGPDFTFTPRGTYAGETLTFTCDVLDNAANTVTTSALNVVVFPHNIHIKRSSALYATGGIRIKRGGVLY